MNKGQNIKLLCIAVALFTSLSMQAQQEMEFSAYFNGVLPSGQFNDDVKLRPDATSTDFAPMNRENIAMGAGAGLGLTARIGWWFDMVGFGELMPYFEASILWNQSNSKVRDAYDKAGATAPAYFNVPVYLGFKYRYDINDIIRPFVEIGIGYDELFITKSDGRDDLWYKFKPSGSLTWEGGLGTYLGRNVSAGLYYIGFGTHKIEYTKKSTGRGDGTPPDHGSNRKLGEFALRIGFHF